MAGKFTIEELQARVLEAPFHQWLGLRVSEAGDGSVTLVMPWRAELVSDPGIRYTHGGILAALVDIAGDYAIATRLGRGIPTIDMRIDYHKAALPGDLTARGNVIKLGRTVSTAGAELFDAQGALIASGRGVYFTAEKS
jgi:uncharacterized protein (TIGR00369 family)